MFSYDASHHDPPAPVANVMLRYPDDRMSWSNQVLLIDTGADVTLLPRGAVERLGVEPMADVRYELAAFDGTRSFAAVAVLDMFWLDRIYRGRYLLIDAEQGVLGRDVLNQLSLLFDGPGQQWSEHK
jgi:predicted aspartyl protease